MCVSVTQHPYGFKPITNTVHNGYYTCTENYEAEHDMFTSYYMSKDVGTKVDSGQVKFHQISSLLLICT